LKFVLIRLLCRLPSWMKSITVRRGCVMPDFKYVSVNVPSYVRKYVRFFTGVGPPKPNVKRS